MIANVGDIYCLLNERLGKYNAFQITYIGKRQGISSKPIASILTLDWFGENLPTEDEMLRMKPLYHDNVPINVPKGYIWVGNIPPVTVREVSGFGFFWPYGYSFNKQAMLERIPKEKRDCFKNCISINSDTNSIMDLRDTYANEVCFSGKNVREIHLNNCTEKLTIHGEFLSNLKIYSEDNGKWLTLITQVSAPLETTLTSLRELIITDIKEIEIQPIVNKYKELRTLNLWGEFGTVHGINYLSDLNYLQDFRLRNLFGFKGEDFPSPTQLPEIRDLWMGSIPEDAAKIIKKAYKEETKNGLELQIYQGRTAEWIAENKDNPFRDWDGRENISSTNSKKAMVQYKATRSQIMLIIEDSKNDKDSEKTLEQLKPICKGFVESFNKMNKRTNFIETMEAEEIFEALSSLIEIVNKEIGKSINTKELYDCFDEVRDF